MCTLVKNYFLLYVMRKTLKAEGHHYAKVVDNVIRYNSKHRPPLSSPIWKPL